MPNSNKPQDAIQDIMSRTMIYMITEDKGYGFTEEGQENIDGIVLEDIPVFIANLQNEGILPQNSKYVQYSIGAMSEDEQRRGENEARAKIIIFDINDSIIDIIPHQDVLAFQEQWLDTAIRRGIKREGFERLVRALI